MSVKDLDKRMIEIQHSTFQTQHSSMREKLLSDTGELLQVTEN